MSREHAAHDGCVRAEDDCTPPGTRPHRARALGGERERLLYATPEAAQPPPPSISEGGALPHRAISST